MSIDILQEKIRKTKNPSVILFEALSDHIPPSVLEGEKSFAAAYKHYSFDVLDGLEGIVPAVRFGFASYSVLGKDGISLLFESMKYAYELGFYVLLDLPEILTPASARSVVSSLCGSDYSCCHGVIVSAYLGSDVLSPMKELVKKGKAVFAVCRTSNKSAVEVQDLLTGGRLVYTAVADVIYRHAENLTGKCGYSHFGAVAAAGSADSLRTLRGKYSRMFLLVDGYDYPNANAKNCSFAFDKLGHGAVVCAASSIVAAWKDGTVGESYVEASVAAAEKMKKNICRYISIL